MKLFLTPALMLLIVVASAQSDTVKIAKAQQESLFKAVLDKYGGGVPYSKMMDTTGMAQYGFKIYDPRIGRYMPADTGSVQSNPYQFKVKAATARRVGVKQAKLRN